MGNAITTRDKPASVDDADALPAGDKQRAQAAKMGSDALRRRLNWQYEKAAERCGIPFEDARLLLNNGVKL